MTPQTKLKNLDQRNPPIPPLRVFIVTRCIPNRRDIEVLNVVSHFMQFTGRGQVLIFSDRVNDPIFGPQIIIRRIINGYVEVQEVSAPSGELVQIPQ